MREGQVKMLESILNWVFLKIRENQVLRDDLRITVGIGESIAKEVSIVKDRNLILFVSNSLSDKEVDELKDALEMLMPHNSYLVIQSDEPVAAIRV
jgi:hypothetical protein